MNFRSVCPWCQTGKHAHDTYSINSPEVNSGERMRGEDAGCPFLATDGQQCRCVHTNARRTDNRHCPTCRCE